MRATLKKRFKRNGLIFLPDEIVEVDLTNKDIMVKKLGTIYWFKIPAEYLREKLTITYDPLYSYYVFAGENNEY